MSSQRILCHPGEGRDPVYQLYILCLDSRLRGNDRKARE